MLRVTQQSSAEGAKQYYATADYYSEGQEIVGAWGGQMAKTLGLEGTVDKRAFEQLCDNLDPRTGKPLTVRTRTERTVGYDFTFSVPKSVSLRYALTGDQAILDAFRSAVDETMHEIESEMQTRVRQNGQNEDRTTANMVWAEFIHKTSRPVEGVPDPHLHAHCFAFNATWDERQRRFKAGQFRDLKRDAPYFQSAFRVRLANKLQDLGIPIERKGDDFELADVPAALNKRFSRRTVQIEQWAEKLGITHPKMKGNLGLETREEKNYALEWSYLCKEWESRLTKAERLALDEVFARKGEPILREQAEVAAVDHAIAHCFIRESVVAERKLLTEALRRGLGSVTLNDVRRELDSRPLIRGVHEGRAMATTVAMRDSEKRLGQIARLGRGKYRPLGNSKRPFIRQWLNAGQRAAVLHALKSRDFVSGIRGAAGTGKTTLESELREALGEAGVPVAAIAQSTGAVEELREKAGFEGAATIARFVRDKKMQETVRRGAVLLDEASLVGTVDMLRIFEIAQELEARVILVGDKRQHRSVLAGEPLVLLEERGGMQVAEVTEIIRQEHGDYNKAARALSRGETASGFAELDKLGWIREIPHAGRYWVLAQAYLSTMLEEKKNGELKTALVVSPTHAEGDRITRFIRDALKADGTLGEEETINTWISAGLTTPQKSDATNYQQGDLLQFHENAKGHVKGSRLVVGENSMIPVQSADRFELYRPATLKLAVQDRVRVTVNGWSQDRKHRLNNGDLFTVQGFTKEGHPIVDHGWVIANGHLAHGYCVTSYAAEGRTVDKVFIGESSQSFGATNQRSFYVPVTRGREQAVIFTDDKEALLRAVQRPDTPLSAMAFAETARRQKGIMARMQKHLAAIRRAMSFDRLHAAKAPQIDLGRSREREYGYG